MGGMSILAIYCPTAARGEWGMGDKEEDCDVQSAVYCIPRAAPVLSDVHRLIHAVHPVPPDMSVGTRRITVPRSSYIRVSCSTSDLPGRRGSLALSSPMMHPQDQMSSADE